MGGQPRGAGGQLVGGGVLPDDNDDPYMTP